MSDTAQLFILAGIWSLIAAALVRFLPNWPARIAVFALLVGIPFWELPYGYYNFENQCIEQTKLRIYERLSPQDSVCIAHFDSGLYRRLVLAGFKRIEVTEGADNAKEHVAEGRLFLINRREAKSTFCLAFEGNISLPWRILRADTSIVRSNDNHPVAKQSYLRWDGMWWQSMASPILGNGGVCFGELNALILALRRGA